MPTANWKRLGELLVRRRIELDPRYSNRQLFASERGLNYRTVSDIERGRRDNYEDATVTSVEVAYGVAAGSVARALGGGELEPLAAPQAARTAASPPRVPAAWDENDPRDDAAARLFRGDTRHDRMIRNIWRLGEAYDTSELKRIDMIEVVDPELAALLRRMGGQSEAGLQRAPQSQVHCNNSVTSGLSGYHRTVPVRDD